jgi:hypothetical protein
MVVHVYLPESELSRVVTGALARVTPVAYPQLVLTGAVESISVTAQVRPGQPVWQKSFHGTIRLDRSDSRLRTGMTVLTEIQGYQTSSALLVPRQAVTWERGRPQCQVIRRGGRTEDRPIVLGQANDRFFEVLGGLQAGDRVALP